MSVFSPACTTGARCLSDVSCRNSELFSPVRLAGSEMTLPRGQLGRPYVCFRLESPNRGHRKQALAGMQPPICYWWVGVVREVGPSLGEVSSFSLRAGVRPLGPYVEFGRWPKEGICVLLGWFGVPGWSPERFGYIYLEMLHEWVHVSHGGESCRIFHEHAGRQTVLWLCRGRAGCGWMDRCYYLGLE